MSNSGLEWYILTLVYLIYWGYVFCLHLDESLNSQHIGDILNDNDIEVGGGYNPDDSNDVHIHLLGPDDDFILENQWTLLTARGWDTSSKITIQDPILAYETIRYQCSYYITLSFSHTYQTYHFIRQVHALLKHQLSTN